MGERFRPQYHFTAEKNMINDPNGLVCYDGEFHLFHQYDVHGAVHWGHAVSRDLVHWKHLPVALYPDVNGQIYSGSVVVDTGNSSGLQAGADPPFVALFTHCAHADGRQTQSLAYSNDRGRAWTLHPNNPLVENPGLADFRDPKVFWHEGSESWVMMLAAGDRVQFLRSPNLIDWTYGGEWGAGHGAHDGVWECPDLFEIAIAGSGERRWVLSVSVIAGAPAGGSGMQYFVGDFDGWSFVNDNAPDTVLWQNWGADFYAGMTWENVPSADGRRLMIAWADNWLYRRDIPTSPFNGQLTVVRDLTLHETPGGLRLAHRPVGELETLRSEPRGLDDVTVPAGTLELLARPTDAHEIVADFDVTASSAAEFGLDVRVGRGQHTRIGYDAHRSVAFVDRTNSGLNPHPAFAARHEARVDPVAGHVAFRILVDRSSVEVFVNDHEQFTDLILPARDSHGVRAFARGGEAVMCRFESFALASIWPASVDEVAHVVSGDWATTILGIAGSHAGQGIALPRRRSPEGGARVTVEIVGARPGNPRRLLSERAAGVIPDYDVVTGSGTAVLLDRASQLIRVIRLGDASAPVVTAAYKLTTNRPYLLEVRSRDASDVLRVDGHELLEFATLTGGLRQLALVVEDAEAVFRLPEA